MTNEPDAEPGSGGHADVARDWSDEARKTPKEFSGVIDGRVITDLHHLFRKKAKVREGLLFAAGLGSLAFGAWCLKLSADDPSRWIDVLYFGLIAFGTFSAWWALAKGWAIHLEGVVVSGEVRSAGIVVEQLDDRAAWDEFASAWVSGSAAILFREPEERTPQRLAFDGLPLHRSFFRSGEDWDDVVQLIRETIPAVRLVGGR